MIPPIFRNAAVVSVLDNAPIIIFVFDTSKTQVDSMNYLNVPEKEIILLSSMDYLHLITEQKIKLSRGTNIPTSL